MNDWDKGKDKIIAELMELRRRLAELETIDDARKQVEEHLRESEERFRKVYAESPIGIALHDSSGKLLDFNEFSREIFGVRDTSAVRGLNLYDYPDIPEEMKKKLSDGETVRYETSLDFDRLREHGLYDPAKSGVMHLDVLMIPLNQGGRGPLTGYMVQLQDITRRKQASEALQESEEKFRLISEQSMLALVIIQDDIIKYANQAAAEIFEYAIEEALSWGPWEFGKVVHPEDRALALEQARRKQRGDEGQIPTYALRIIDREAKVKWIEVYSKTVLYQGRTAFLIAATDITESKRIRDRRKNLSRLFLSLGPDLIENMERIIAAAQDIMECSYATFCILSQGRLSTLSTLPGEEGFTVATESAGHISCDLILRDSREPMIVSDLGETEYLRTDPIVQQHGFRSYMGYPVVVEGRTVGCLSLFDCGEGKFSAEDPEAVGMLAQALSVEQQRLDHEENLKDFIDIASHELRHPLTIIKGYALTLRELWKELNEQNKEALLRAIEYGADRLDRLVTELLNVSHIERGRFTMQKQEAHLEPLVQSAVAEMREKGWKNDFRISISGDLDSLIVDPRRLTSVFVILLDNAAKYSPEGSEIDILVEIEDELAVVSIIDRGPGIPEDLRERIFNRFFQVEDAQHHSLPGMGIGLYIAKEIVEAHEGRISYEPREDGGSIFRFTLPRGEASDKPLSTG